MVIMSNSLKDESEGLPYEPDVLLDTEVKWTKMNREQYLQIISIIKNFIT